jgi:hypothetical protein
METTWKEVEISGVYLGNDFPGIKSYRSLVVEIQVSFVENIVIVYFK